MKNGRWQAKDIDDRFFLRCVWDHFPHWVFTWNLERMMPIFPSEVILAKARALLKRGLLTGCGCGCRGDFELTPEGERFLRGDGV